ncbi:MAG TPA: hypothetical protein PLY60_08960, partial [Bacillota bacterium]|nr:hypothetical protein [Bacillota bacterium]
CRWFFLFTFANLIVHYPIVNSYLDKERIKQISQSQEEKKNIEKQIKRKQAELEKHENALKLAREKLEEGVYSDEDFLDAKKEGNLKLQNCVKKLFNLRTNASLLTLMKN